MWLKLRIIFTIVSAVLVAAVIPLGVWLGWLWAGIAGLSAFVFYMLMLWCKGHQPAEEDKTEQTDDKQDNE